MSPASKKQTKKQTNKQQHFNSNYKQFTRQNTKAKDAMQQCYNNSGTVQCNAYEVCAFVTLTAADV